MEYKYHLIFIGVNHGVKEYPGVKGYPELKAAENDATALSHKFSALGLNNPTYNVLLTGAKATRQIILDELQKVAEVSGSVHLALVYWAGHMIQLGPSDNPVHHLVTNNTSHPTDQAEMVLLGELISAFTSCRAKRRILILDTCLAENAIDGLRQIRRASSDVSYVLAGSSRNQSAREDERHGYLTGKLLEQITDDAVHSTKLNLSDVFQKTAKKVQEVHRQSVVAYQDSSGGEQLDITIKPPHDTHPSTDHERDPLEQALGYAAQAFREYLNLHVVEGVELIYFLSYDVWDGCLVYDGLVRDSPEQKLLDYIRNRFLRRDRLRSRYEEITCSQNNSQALGAAGLCFQKALSSRNPINELQYFGDLDAYSSEYREFDRLLGLRCCLYIPVVAPKVFKRGKGNLRQPLGGVLMAASRTPYGLVPQYDAASKSAHESARNYYAPHVGGSLPEDNKNMMQSKDGAVTRSIVGYLTEQPMQVQSIEAFLRCIGGVYEQRAERRVVLRNTFHPRFAKAALNEMKSTSPQVNHSFITNVSDAVKKWVENKRFKHEYNEVVFANEVRTSPADFVRVDGNESQEEQNKKRALGKDYLIAYVWRDLALATERFPVTKPEVAQEINAACGPDEGSESWKAHVEKVAGCQTAAIPEPRSPRAGEVPEFLTSLVNDLIDDIRDSLRPPERTYLETLVKLVPINKYVSSISDVENILPMKERNAYLNDLAHSLQMWLLGVWMIRAGLDRKCREQMAMYVKGGAPDRIGVALAQKFEKDSANDLLLLSWTVIAGLHDVANPVERFDRWMRSFFGKYMGEGAIDEGWKPAVRLNIFDIYEFPVYKNMITGLHQTLSQERDWLDTLFCQAFYERVAHPITGSLILTRELDPKQQEPQDLGLWRMLVAFIKEVIGDDPRSRLWFPAYLAHAAAFTNLPQMKKAWLEKSENMKKSGKQPYFNDIAQNFVVKFDEYPLTFLLGLCDVLIGSPCVDLESKYDLTPIYDPDSIPTASPFYVSNIKLEKETSCMIIDLSLWGETINEECVKVSEEKWLKELKVDYGQYIKLRRDHKAPFEWSVFGDKRFAEQGPTWDSVRCKKRPGWAECTVQDNPHQYEYRIQKSTFEVLRMVLKLEKFAESFKSETVKFKVRFMNVPGINKPEFEYELSP